MTDQPAQRGTAHHALERWPANVFHVRAPGLDDAAVRYARRTNSLARSAPEAQVDVLHLLFVKGNRSALPLGHEVDAPARRLGLESGNSKRRTRVERQSAVDAGGEVVDREPGKVVCLPRLRRRTAVRRGWGWPRLAQT